MSKVSNFDVLREMGERGMNIQLAPLDNIVEMRKVKAGTNITIGVAGDVLKSIYFGKFVGGMLLADKEQFDTVKRELESAPSLAEFGHTDITVLGGGQAMSDVKDRARETAWDFYERSDEWTNEKVYESPLDFADAFAESALRALGEQLEFDRSAVAGGVTAIKKAVNNRHWLTEGCGPYEWNDDNWHQEFKAAAVEVLSAVEPLAKIAANWKDCPQTAEEVAKARIDLQAKLAAAEAQVTALGEALDFFIPSREKLAEYFKAKSGKVEHASDCSTSSAPAELPGPCNCD